MTSADGWKLAFLILIILWCIFVGWIVGRGRFGGKDGGPSDGWGGTG